MIRTPLCDLLGTTYPIVQGGMAWIATAELAAAVSEAGGLGVIGGGDCPPDYVRDQVRLAKSLTDRPFGVNIPLFSPHVPSVIDVCIEEGVRVIMTGAGNPGPHVPKLKQAGIVVIPVVASVALARRLARSGVDALVAEGTESGGHIGDVGTMPLVPQVVDAVSVPVIAAGGIADGRGLVAALALGAQGIQMGTRFVCTTECIAHDNYKQKLVRSGDRATVTTGHSLGHPVRAIRNRMTHEFAELERSGCSEEEVIRFGTGRLRRAALEGDVETGSVMSGQSCGLVNDILPCAQVIERIMAEAEACLQSLARYVTVGAG
ncbi:MAG: enoyl-[acyl-carrier-protein] reductase FabK [Anaerolineae bacterium]|nr:enoyl-[acyl-carrier-protein] reductase FabK [Anaerolineae bacterium]